ncbi:MAG: protein translocase SEC61 complex subunit gamma [Candidatus Micrarchaeota archaeon]
MKIADLIKRCIRILHISRKPTNAEFSQVAKVTALGMFLFGLVGFIISFLFGFIR